MITEIHTEAELQRMIGDAVNGYFEAFPEVGKDQERQDNRGFHLIYQYYYQKKNF